MHFDKGRPLSLPRKCPKHFLGTSSYLNCILWLFNRFDTLRSISSGKNNSGADIVKIRFSLLKKIAVLERRDLPVENVDL